MVDARGAGFGVNADFAEGLASFAICAVEELVFRALAFLQGKFVGIIQFVICTFPAAILSILYMNKRSYDPVAFSIFRAFANNMVSFDTF